MSTQDSKTGNIKTSSTEETEFLKNEIKNETSVRKPIVIQLEPSLEEKLAKSRAVADELEERLQNLREKFEENLILAKSTKDELKRREIELLQSVQKIEGYMQEMYSLDKVAGDMYDRFGDMMKESENREFDLLEQCINISMKRNIALSLIENFQHVKVFLEDLVYDLPQFSSAKQLVNYFLVLDVLNKELLEEDKERIEEEERSAIDRQKIVESARAHPLTIRAKEDVVQRLEAELKAIHAQNVELGQQVDSAISAKAKEELLWYDTERWVSKLYKTTREALPVESEDPDEDNLLGQLRKICDFVFMGNKISNRLKEKSTV